MQKGNLKIVKGDATEPQNIYDKEVVVIPHVCNNKGGFGAGFVLALNKKWEEPKEVYRKFCEENRKFPILGQVCYAKINNFLVVANMIGQDGTVSINNPKPIKYRHLANAMVSVLNYIEMIKSQTSTPVVIHCCKFGSDLAGGNFDFITELIEEIWIENGIDVVIYEYEPNKDKWGEI